MDGAAGRLNASEAEKTRPPDGALKSSRGFTVADRRSLRPNTKVGLEQDSSDAETGTDTDIGGGVAFSNTPNEAVAGRSGVDGGGLSGLKGRRPKTPARSSDHCNRTAAPSEAECGTVDGTDQEPQR